MKYKPYRKPPASGKIEELLNQIHDCNISVENREIYLHSFYDRSDMGESGVEYRNATTFIKNLHILESISIEPILVHMHMHGGEWGDGFAMIDAIRFSRCPITILTYAQASSMSGIILQAADHRILMPNCEFMIHYGEISVSNNALAARATIKQEEYNCQLMLDVFSQRAYSGSFFVEKKYTLKKTRDYIDSRIKKDGDWIMNAAEAVEFGFADCIMGSDDCPDLYCSIVDKKIEFVDEKPRK